MMDLKQTAELLRQALGGELSESNQAQYLREFIASKGITDPELMTINDLVECFATLEAMKIVRHQKAAAVAIHRSICARLTNPVPLAAR